MSRKIFFQVFIQKIDKGLIRLDLARSVIETVSLILEEDVFNGHAVLCLPPQS
jgi:hypothetical protein